MGCTFCGIGRRAHRELPSVCADVTDQAERGVARVSFGGGEPTLHPSLAEIIRHAAEAGFSERQVETNALRLSQRAYLQELLDAGLSHARVMLPATTTEGWDRV